MRIAVCLSGQPRAFRAAAKNILKTFRKEENVQVDYYIFSWTDNITPYSLENIKLQEDIVELERDLTELYHPKKLEIRSEKEIDKAFAFLPVIQDDFYQIYHFARVLSLVPKDEEYDWCFWTRIDNFMFNSTIDTYEDWKAPRLNYKTIQVYSQDSRSNDLIYMPINGDRETPVHYASWARFQPTAIDLLYAGRVDVLRNLSLKTFVTYLRDIALLKHGDKNFLEWWVPYICTISGIGIRSVPFLENNEELQCGVYRQVFEEANVSLYTALGFKFSDFDNYYRLYMFDITSEYVQKLYELYQAGYILPPFTTSDSAEAASWSRAKIEEYINNPTEKRKVKIPKKQDIL